jgi:hypothetical protein
MYPDRTVRTRTDGSTWRIVSATVTEGGILGLPSARSVALEFEVLAAELTPPAHILDRQGGVEAGQVEVVLRAYPQPNILVVAEDGRPLAGVVVAEEGQAADGAHPLTPHPGPTSALRGKEHLSNPFPSYELLRFAAPLLGADGHAWKKPSPTLVREGGLLELSEEHTLDLTLTVPPQARIRGTVAIDIVLYEASRFDPKHAPRGMLRYALRVETRDVGSNSEVKLQVTGLECPISLVGAALVTEERNSFAGQVRPTPTSNAREQVASIVLGRDGSAGVAEGFLEFEDIHDAQAVERIQLFSMEPQASIDEMIGPRLERGNGLSIIDARTLRWEARGLSPGAYAVYMEPLGAFTLAELEATEGIQSTYAYIPTSVEMVVRPRSAGGAALAAQAKGRFFVLMGDFEGRRPPLVPMQKPLEPDEQDGLLLRAPRGAQAVVSVWVPTDQQPRETHYDRLQTVELEVLAGSIREIQLSAPMRSLHLRLASPDGPVTKPLDWWSSNLSFITADGREQPVLLGTIVSTDARPLDPDRFTRWGYRRDATEDARYGSFDVRVAGDAVAIALRSSSSTGPTHRVELAPDRTEFTLDLGLFSGDRSK